MTGAARRPGPVRIRRIDSGDPDQALVAVSNGPLALTFLPGVGGRLLSVRREGVEYLWRNPRFFDADLRAVVPRRDWPRLTDRMESWSNVGGSKTWPAPQGWSGPGEWAGPPDPVLDSGSWRLRTTPARDGGLRVALVSPDDPRTGLRVTRGFDIRPGATSIVQEIEFANVTDRAVRWAAWEVCQVDTSPDSALGGDIEIAQRTGAGVTRLLSPVGAVAVDRARSGAAVIRRQPGVAKLGFPEAAGRIAVGTRSGPRLTLSWDVDPEAVYPDGCVAEIWTQSPQAEPIESLEGLHPTEWVAELEPLFPLVTLAPRESTRHRLTWEFEG